MICAKCKMEVLNYFEEKDKQIGQVLETTQHQSVHILKLESELAEAKHLLKLWIHVHMADENAEDDLMIRTSKFLEASK